MSRLISPTRRCLISSAISLINACVAGCPVIVRRVIHRSNAFSSAIDRSYTCSLDCATVLPFFMCLLFIARDEILNVFVVWLGFCHCFFAILHNVWCIRASHSALFLLLERVIVVHNWKEIRLLIFMVHFILCAILPPTNPTEPCNNESVGRTSSHGPGPQG